MGYGRTKAFGCLYKSLSTKDGEKSIYKFARGRERQTRDLDQVKCINDDEGKVWVKEHDIKDRCDNYLMKDINFYSDLVSSTRIKTIPFIVEFKNMRL